MDHILLFLKNKYNLKTDKEVAQKIGVNYNTFKNWVVRDAPNYLVLLEFAEKNGIDLNTFLSETKNTLSVNDMNISTHLKKAISFLDEDRQDLLTLAVLEADNSDNYSLFDDNLIDFYISSKFKSDFMVETKQKNFWKELIFSERKKIVFTLLLGKILSSFDIDIENITEDKAKGILIDLVRNYQLQFLSDHVKHGLEKTKKDDLLEWIEKELNDFEAYTIVKNIPSILKVFRKGINSLNKNAF